MKMRRGDFYENKKRKDPAGRYRPYPGPTSPSPKFFYRISPKQMQTLRGPLTAEFPTLRSSLKPACAGSGLCESMMKSNAGRGFVRDKFGVTG